jgi:hypothetical protein
MLTDFIDFLQENKLVLFLFYAFIFVVSRMDVHIGMVLATMLVYAHAVDLWQNSELYVEFEYGTGGGDPDQTDPPPASS